MASTYTRGERRDPAVRLNRPLTAASSSTVRRSTAAFTTSDVPSTRIAESVRHYKSMLLQRPLPSHSVVHHGAAPGEMPGPRRRDHLLLHRREWSQQEIVARLGVTRATRGAMAKLTSDESTVREQIEAFSKAHNDLVDLDADDPEDAAILQARAEVQRRNNSLGKTRPQRTTANKSRRLKVPVVSGESIALRYMVSLDRLLHVAETVSAAAMRRLLGTLERQEGEPILRSGRDPFKALKLQQYMSIALSPALLDESVVPQYAAQRPPAPSLLLGSALTREEAESIFSALDVFHDGFIALRPSVAALVYVGGSRTAADFTQYVFAALAAHDASITLTDVLCVTRYAKEVMKSRSLPYKWLTPACLGRADAAARASARFREGLHRPDDIDIVYDLDRLGNVLFGPPVSAAVLRWFDAVDMMGSAGTVPALYALALATAVKH